MSKVTTKEIYDLIHKIDKKIDVNTEHTKGIEKHLETLNSKVATNIREIARLDKEQVLFLQKFEGVSGVVDGWEKSKKKDYEFWKERIIYILLILGMTVLKVTGIINL